MTASKTMKDYTDHVVKNCDGDNTVTLVRKRTVYVEGFESIGFDDFEQEETEYVAFPSDVTNFTDDAIAFLFNYQPWDDGFDGIHLASYELDED